jgi:uncharacterized repeat protein (TIGR01451 family)
MSIPAVFVCARVALRFRTRATFLLRAFVAVTALLSSAHVTAAVLAPSGVIVFDDSTLGVGESTTMRIGIGNASASTAAITNLGFTDNYPIGIVNAISPPLPASTNCRGPGGSLAQVTAVASGRSLAISGVELSPGGSCVVSVPVVGSRVGAHTNVTSALTSNNAPPGNPAQGKLTVLPGQADVAIAIASPASSVGAETPFSFSVTVSNNGNATVYDALLTDNQMTNFTPTGVTCVGDAAGTSLCPDASAMSVANLEGGGIAIPQIIPGGDVVFKITGVSGATSAAYVSNLVKIFTAAGVTDTVPSNNAASASMAIGGGMPRLVVTKAPSANPLSSTGDYYTIIVRNDGDAPSNDVITIDDNLTEGANFVGYQGSDAGWFCTPGGAHTTCAYDPNVVAHPLPPGGQTMLRINVALNLFAKSGDNVVTMTGGGDASCSAIPQPANCVGSTTAAVASKPAVSVTLGANPSSFVAGATAAYALSVSNIGTAPTSGVISVTDTLPVGLAATSVTAPSPWSCDISQLSTGAFTCSRSDALAAGASYALPPITVNVNVLPSAAANLTNTARISGGGDASCPAPATGQVPAVHCTDSATTNVVGERPTVKKTFLPASISIGDLSQMTIEITNPSSTHAMNGVEFSDAYPPGMANAGNAVVQSNSCGGVVIAAQNDTSVALTDGAIPVGQTCSVVVNVVGTGVGTVSNHVGIVTSNDTQDSLDAVGTLVVSGSKLAAPTVTKEFDSANILLGGSSRMSITLKNGTSQAVTGVALTDTYPPGMSNASSNVILRNTCGGPVTAPANGASLALTGGSIGPNSSCVIAVTVAGNTVDNLVNHTGAVTSANAETGADASAGLTISAGSLLNAPTLTKQFAPTSIPLGSTTTMTLTLTNPNTQAITGVNVTDNYPATGMVNGSSNVVSNTCGGTVTASPGGKSVALAGGVIPGNGNCAITMSLVGTVVGAKLNRTDSVTSANATTGAAASATLTVTAASPLTTPPTVAKVFSPAGVMLNGASQMTITLTNPNGTSIVGAAFTDNYPGGMINAAGGVVLDNTCGGTVTAAAGGTSVALANGTVLANSSCHVVIGVIGIVAGNAVNHTGPLTSTNAPVGADTTGTLTVTPGVPLAPPTLAKAFSPTSVPLGGVSTMTLKLTNPNNFAITQAAFADNYPSGLLNAQDPAIAGNTCGGTLQADLNDSLMTLDGATIPATGSCTITLAVLSTASGALLNQTTQVTSANAAAGAAASATLTVDPAVPLTAAPTVAKAFTPATIAVGGTTQLKITLSNPNPTAILGARFTDTYPAGIANAAIGGVRENTCGGAITSTGGGTSLALSGGIVPGNSSCDVIVNVVGLAEQTVTNHTGAVTSTNAPDGTDATATLHIGATSSLLTAPALTESFSAAQIVVGDVSTMTLALTNPNGQDITGVSLTDIYPNGMVNGTAASVAGNTCGGTLTGTTGGSSLGLTDGTIPANGSCAITMSVIGTLPGAHDNVTSAVTSANADDGASAQATLTVNASPPLATAPTATKSFAPANVVMGGVSQMTISLANPNDLAVVNAGFNDTYPAGLTNVANAPVQSNSCGGTLFATASGASAALSGGTIPAHASCEVVISVVAASVGTITNDTGPITSANAPTGANASGTLDVVAGTLLAAPQFTKSFASGEVALGDTTTLTLKFDNANGSAITGVSFDDACPSGMVNAGAAASATNTCGGTLTADARGAAVSLAGGTIPQNGSCSIQIDVIATSTGSHTNRTSIVTSSNASPGLEASADLIVDATDPLVAAPTVTKSFAPSSLIVGNTTTLTITLTNANASAVVGAELTDLYPDGMTNAATDVVTENTCGGTLTAEPSAASARLVNGTIPAGGECHVKLSLLATSAGSWTNHTGAVSSVNAPDGADTTATLDVDDAATLQAPTAAKAFAPSTLAVGDASLLTITLTNPNGVDLVGATFNDEYPLGMSNAAAGVVAENTCGGTVSADVGGGFARLDDGTIPADGECHVSVNIVATATGSLENDTGAIDTQDAPPGASATATLNVGAIAALDSPNVSKKFEPATVAVGGATLLTITIDNPNANDIDDVAFTDTYPGGMANAASAVLQENTCGGTIVADANANAVGLGGGTLAGSSSCHVSVNVVATDVGTWTNHTGTVTSGNAEPGADTTASLTVSPAGSLNAPTATKTFSPATIPLGGTSLLTLSISNGNGQSINGVSLTDTYPPGMINAAGTPVVSNTCGGPVTAAAGGNAVSLAGGSIAANGSCAIKINLVATSTGALVNRTGPINSADAPAGAAASATLTVSAQSALIAVDDRFHVHAATTFDTTSASTGQRLDNMQRSVLANDRPQESVAVIVANPTHGSLTLADDGTFRYDNSDSATTSGTDAFTYKACLAADLSTCSPVASVSIDVVPQSDTLPPPDANAPIAVDDAAIVASGGSIDTTAAPPVGALIGGASRVLSNDLGHAKHAVLVYAPEHIANAADFALLDDGTFRYRNNADAATADSFAYEACSDDDVCSAAIVTLTISNSATDAIPVAVDDLLQVAPGMTLDTTPTGGDSLVGGQTSALGNDTDTDAATGELFATLLSPPHAADEAVFAFNADGTVVYKSDAANDDRFVYEACDAFRACAAATVSAYVTNDPLDRLPNARDDQASVAVGGTTSVLIDGSRRVLDNDDDPDNGETQGLRAVMLVGAGPNHGLASIAATGTFSYANDGSGTSDHFDYEACDTHGGCSRATVWVAIGTSAAPTVSCLLLPQMFVAGDANGVDIDLTPLFAAPTGQSLAFGFRGLPSPPISIDPFDHLVGTFGIADVGTYTATLTATNTQPPLLQASEDVEFKVLDPNDKLLRDGFDGPNAPVTGCP